MTNFSRGNKPATVAISVIILVGLIVGVYLIVTHWNQLFNRCQKHITYQGDMLKITGFKAQVDESVVELGDIAIDSEAYREASEQLQKLDINQYTICQQINALPNRSSQEELRVKYINLLFEFQSIATNPESYRPETDPFMFYFVYEVGDRIKIDSFSLPYGDVKKLTSVKESILGFADYIQSIDNKDEYVTKSNVFRITDEVIIDTDPQTFTKGSNTGVIVIPKSILQKVGDNHIAFTQIKSFIDRQKFEGKIQ